MIKNIYAITIAVNNLNTAVCNYEALVGTKARYSLELSAETTLLRFLYQREDLSAIGFDSEAEVAYFQLPGGTRIVLLTSSDESSVIGKFLAKHGEGVMMVSLEVDDPRAEVDRIKGQGTEFCFDKNAIGTFGEANYIHPKAMNGVQFEIIKPAGIYKPEEVSRA